MPFMRFDRALPLLMVTACLAAALPASAQDAAKGASLLEAARTALGGADKLAAVKTLEMKGEFRRAQGNTTQEGDFDIQIQGPDKYRLDEESGTAGGPTTSRTQVLNGTDVWDDNSNGGFPGGGRGGFGGGGFDGGGRGGFDGGGFRGRRGDGGGDAQAGGGAQGRGQIDPERVRELQRRQRQTDLDHLLIVTLLSSTAPVTWIGTAQSPDGTADVLEFKPADGAATRLFLDTTTHMPLMITWEGAAPRGGGFRGRGGRGGGNAQGRGDQGAAPQGAPAGAPQGGADQPQGRRAGGAGQPQTATLEMHLTDYKAFNGIKLPTLISRGANGQTQEELTVKSYKINPNFKSNTFNRSK